MTDILSISYNLHCNEVMYQSPQSLQELATTQIAIQFWAHKNAHMQIKLSGLENYLRKKKLYEYILQNIKLLILPKRLRQNVEYMIVLTGTEVLVFMYMVIKNTESLKYCMELILQNVCWTSQGTVNKKRSAEALVDCDKISLKDRLRIACHYCLEDKINKLAMLMPEDAMENENYYCAIMKLFKNINIAKEHFKMTSTLVDYRMYYGYLIQNCIKYDDENAEAILQYCWLQLPKDGQMNSLKNSAYLCYYNLENVNIYQFCALKQEEKYHLLHCEDFTLSILKTLVEWRWLPFFLSTLHSVIDFISQDKVINLIEYIINFTSITELKERYRDTVLQILQTYRTTKLTEMHKNCENLVWICLEANEIDAVKEILIAATSEEKKQMLMTGKGKTNLRSLIQKRNWDTFTSYVNFMLSSEDDRQNFKIDLIKDMSLDAAFDTAFYLAINKKWESLNDIFLNFIPRNKSFKKDFVEKKGFEICQTLLLQSDFNSVDEFLKQCFDSEGEMNTFLIKFVQSEEFKNVFLFSFFK